MTERKSVQSLTKSGISAANTRSPLWTVEPHARNIHSIDFNAVSEGWSQWVMLSGDRHHDNAHCLHDLEVEHLTLAVRRKAIIIDVGDLFCAMQGKYDPRSSLSALRVEDKKDDYLDSLVRNAADFYGPYSDLFAVIGQGNHESSILKRCGSNLTQRLCDELTRENGKKGQIRPVYAGGYGGWIRFNFKSRGRELDTKRLKYFHGSGGGGPVTKGVIQTNRRAVYLPDADFVVSGHIHEAWVLPMMRERYLADNSIVQDSQWHCQVPTYKDEYGNGEGGWHIETGKPPKPVGCCWLQFSYQDGRIVTNAQIQLRA